MRLKTIVWLLFFPVMSAHAGIPPAGLNHRTIEPGDEVRLDMNCRLTSGEIVVTTHKEIADNPGQPKAVIYEALKQYEPVVIKAGDGKTYSGKDPLKAFNKELFAGVSEALVGMRVGEHKTVTLQAAVDPAIKPEDRYIRLARLRTFPREIKATKSQYQRLYGKEPVMGAVVDVGMGVKGQVLRFAGEEIIVGVTLKTGEIVPTPWGPATVTEKEHKFEIHINPEFGRLVRTGPYVGRVDRIEPENYIMDFGHPFGVEAIVCEVQVQGIQAAATGEAK